MLFDLRGRHRRRAVRVIYIGLAFLIGVGLIGFGIGGGFGGGGLLTSGGGEGSSAKSFAGEVKRYRKLTVREPRNPAGWEKLTKALLHEPGGFSETGEITSKGKETLGEAAQAWASYLALNPKHPNTELAALMGERVFAEGALNEPAKAAEALQIVVASRPTSAHFWSFLAIYAYKSGNVRQGDLASAKAVSFTPSAQRVRVKKELAEVKVDPNGEKTFTTVTNGKTYVGKKGPNGTFTGTELQKTPAPATGSTTTKK